MRVLRLPSIDDVDHRRRLAGHRELTHQRDERDRLELVDVHGRPRASSANSTLVTSLIAASRQRSGSMLDPLEPVMRRVLEEWPEIKAPRVTEILREDYGYAGSVDLVRKRLAALRPRVGAGGAADGLSAGAGAAGRLGRDADAAADRGARAAGLRVDLLVAVLGRLDGALHAST